MSDNNSNEHQSASSSPSTNDDAPLGIAGRVAGAFIRSPLTPLFLIASLVAGLIGIALTPRQEDPQISVPMVDIFVKYPGGSSDQVASLVTEPLERMMNELTGVDHVYSASERDRALVTVQFDVGEEKGPSLVKLYDKLASNLDKIPPGASEPLVKPKGINDVPIVTFTFWSQEVDDATLHQIALEVMQRANELPNINKGFVVHGRQEQLRIEVLPEKLAGYELSMDKLANTIRAANKERGLGRMESGDSTFKLYTGEFLRTAEDVESLVIGAYRGQPIYVRDVANVYLGPGEAHQLVRHYTGPAYGHGGHSHEGEQAEQQASANGAPAVTLAIAKKKGSNGVVVAQDVINKVNSLQGRIIPDNVKVDVTRNYGETAKQKVNGLLKKLLIATFIVTALVWYFLGWRAATVVLVVIPIVILVAVFSAWVLGFTIDRVSLFALIFSIGILVDDAIVVVENIYRRWLIKSEIDSPTAVAAVDEVGNPTILATGTVIAALLPMAMVSGMMGPYMMPIPALGSVAMAFSLFAAFVFTPWLAMLLKPSLRKLGRMASQEHRSAEMYERLYRFSITPMLKSRWKGSLFLLAVIVAFFASVSLFYTTDVRVKMLPLDNKPEFQVMLNMPEGTALPRTANVIQDLAEEVQEIPEVVSLQSYAGTASPYNFNGLVRHYYLRQNPWQGDIQVQLIDKHDRPDRTSHQIAVEVRERLTPIATAAGARIEVVEMPPGPPVLQSVVAEVYGPREALVAVAEDLTQMFEKAQYLTDEDNFLQAEYQVYDFVVQREKASRIGVSVADINETLAMAMGGYELGDVKFESRMVDPVEIVLQVPLSIRHEFSRIGQLPVATQVSNGGGQTAGGRARGDTVPLAELGYFKPRPQDPVIYHKDLRPLEYVTAETAGRLAAPVYGMLEVEKMLEDYESPTGEPVKTGWMGPPSSDYTSANVAFEWGGEWTVTYETFRDMGIAFAGALVLIYILVVAQFGNFILPMVVMAPIPLTLIGIIPGHWLFNAEFTATSMIGFIALAGIIVRNSILLVDFAKHEVDHGQPVSEAVIQACKARTRPIIITALALVGGSAVILADPIFQGMAVSLMFGVIVSTVLTLLVIPLGCVSVRHAFCLAGPASQMAPTPCENDPLLSKGRGNGPSGPGPSGPSGPDDGAGSGPGDSAARRETSKSSRSAALATAKTVAIYIGLIAQGIFYLLRWGVKQVWALSRARDKQIEPAETMPASGASGEAASTAAQPSPLSQGEQTLAVQSEPAKASSSGVSATHRTGQAPMPDSASLPESAWSQPSDAAAEKSPTAPVAQATTIEQEAEQASNYVDKSAQTAASEAHAESSQATQPKSGKRGIRLKADLEH